MKYATQTGSGTMNYTPSVHRGSRNFLFNRFGEILSARDKGDRSVKLALTSI
jgi:hypothetical protein